MSSDKFDKLSKLNPENSKDSGMSEVGYDIQTPDEKRKDNEKKHIHWIKLAFLYVLAGIFVLVGVAVALNLVFPQSLRWLDKQDLMELKSIFVSGVGGALLGKFGNKIVE